MYLSIEKTVLNGSFKPVFFFYSMSHLKYITFLKLQGPKASLRVAAFPRVHSSSPVSLTRLPDGPEPLQLQHAPPYLPSDKSSNSCICEKG